MMKNLLFITLTLVSTFIFAQDCVVNTSQGPFIDDPDESYSMQLEGTIINSDESSFSPNLDTLTALPHAIVGLPFSTYVGIRIPVDTAIVTDLLDPGNPTLIEGIQISSLVLSDVTGLPMGFEFACDNDCDWSGGDYGCVSIYSSSAVPDIAGGGMQAYPLNFILSIDATVEFFGIPVPQNDVEVNNLLDYYVLVVAEDNTNTNDIIDARKFTHLGTVPNPATSSCAIQYGNDDNSIVDLKLFDVLGNLVFSNTYQSKIGYNQIDLDLNQFNSGIYTFVMSNENHNITKRIIVK